MPAAQPDLALRHDLLERLSDARTRTDELFGIVRRESLYERPIPERHRIVFYIGHLEAFDWNLMRERLFDEKSFDLTLDKLFAFGIDPVGGGLPADQPSDWPSLDAVNKYVSRIREAIDARLPELLQPNARRREFSPMQLLNVAIEHRLMHAETLAYMLHQLPLDKKIPQARRPELVTAPQTPRMIEIPRGIATLGLARDEGVFGWDNEFERHTVDVPGFAIDQYKVTNREFLNFVSAGGYESRALWSDAGWAWKNENRISHPVFWKAAGDAWQYRTMFHDVPLPLDWPVYVSHAEANAYARWAGKTLPTEAQWHRTAYANERGERQYPWGDEQPTPRRGNFDFQSWDPAPVAASAAGQSAFGVRDLLGNGWEWTSTLFAPFPGFERFSFYPGYSADFFDGKHYVMKGGSPRTAACMLRRSFRNWFQPHYQYVYAGFRCVTN
jgi:gamma-glutamyl hercynylcysteine S-oxide synthase